MLLAVGGVLLLSGPVATAARPAMPPAVTAHYRDYNFVNAFSSQAERQVLARSATAPADHRLAQVARALARLDGQTEELDPGIVLMDPTYGGGRPRHASEFRSDLVRPTSWYVDQARGEAWVELEVLVLEDETAGLLVANYDRLTHGGKSMPGVDALIAIARWLPLRSVERHHWRHLDGEWRREPAVLNLTSP